jgi:hypothetical protein
MRKILQNKKSLAIYSLSVLALAIATTSYININKTPEYSILLDYDRAYADIPSGSGGSADRGTADTWGSGGSDGTGGSGSASSGCGSGATGD